ncbi:MAG: precorrin-6A synthase (deacetylating) [Actinomycetes bacterium]
MNIEALIVGVGTGNPDHLTVEAIAALNAVEVFLVADKGAVKRDLTALRTEICRRHIRHDRYRVVEMPDPERERGGADYDAAVADWHVRRADAYAEVMARELPRGGTVGFLVWGDPAFYDSTIRIADDLVGREAISDFHVVPGISSLQLLAAAHRIVLNQIGQPVHITTGRRLVAEYTADLGDVVVMLDGDLACGDLVPLYPDLEIFWGAQLGLPDQQLRAGRLGAVIEEIRAVRSRLRDRRGWVMDTYLLRR